MDTLEIGVPSNRERASPEEVSMRVIEQLERTLGREATDIEPLAASVDPDALGRFVSSAPVGTVLAFIHAGCQIQLRKDTSNLIVGVSREYDIGT